LVFNSAWKLNGEVRPHEVLNFGFQFDARSAPVQLLEVRPTGIGAGLKIIAVRAVRSSETTGVGVLRGRYLERWGARVHPVTDVRIVPGDIPDWYVVIEAAGDRVGTLATKALEVRYRARGREYAQVAPYKIELRVSPTALPDTIPLRSP
jgi:hypothetical protein